MLEMTTVELEDRLVGGRARSHQGSRRDQNLDGAGGYRNLHQ